MALQAKRRTEQMLTLAAQANTITEYILLAAPFAIALLGRKS